MSETMNNIDKVNKVIESSPLTKEELKELLHYDRDSGIFTRVKNTGNVKKGDIAGCVRHDGYIIVGVKGKSYLAHRLAWLYEYGEFSTLEIDHINRIKSDNRIENLREATPSHNQRNQPKAKNNTSGATGVRFEARSNRWTARIGVDGKDVSLGAYATFHEALDARKNAEVLYGFSETHGKDL